MILKKLFGRGGASPVPPAAEPPRPPEPERGPMLISGFDTADIEPLAAAFEKRLKAELPPQYRRFLLKYNGGETPNTDFHTGEVSSDLRALYGLGRADPHYHFDKLGRSLHSCLKQGMLPIGENACGDTIALRLSGEGTGGVYFLYHDRAPRDFIFLTEDFAGFTALCSSKPLGHIRSVEERAEGLRARGRTPTPELAAMWEKEIAHMEALRQEPLEF